MMFEDFSETGIDLKQSDWKHAIVFSQSLMVLISQSYVFKMN